MLNWGATSDEQRMRLPGGDIASGMPPRYTKAVTINAPPAAVWPWLQQLHIGDRINAGMAGKVAVGNPVTVLEPGRALVIGTWAFILQPCPATRPAAGPQPRLGLPEGRRPALSAIDYLVGDPLHFAMERKDDARPRTARRTPVYGVTVAAARVRDRPGLVALTRGRGGTPG